jgi:hypothetical protein
MGDVAENPVTEEFDNRVDHLLQVTCEVARAVAAAHQAAMAMLVAGDWTQARKYFSLSEKYEQWKDFTAPARGIGLHALVMAKNEAICLTQEEVEQHPEWRAFADSAGKHPPAAAWAPRRADRRRGLSQLWAVAGLGQG